MVLLRLQNITLIFMQGIKDRQPKHRRVPGVRRKQAPSEPAQRQRAPEKKQVRRAAAVGRAETGTGDNGARHPLKSACPAVFARVGIGAAPYGANLYQGPHIVDVPVGRCARAQMVADPGFKPAGPKGAADIDIVTFSEAQPAQATDPDKMVPGGGHDQRVSAGQIRYLFHDRSGFSTLF